jgi:hypothetical protein
MAKQVDPFAKIVKKLDALKAKASKLNADIAELSVFVAAESKKASKAAPVANAPAKKAAAKTSPKKAATPKAVKLISGTVAKIKK